MFEIALASAQEVVIALGHGVIKVSTVPIQKLQYDGIYFNTGNFVQDSVKKWNGNYSIGCQLLAVSNQLSAIRFQEGRKQGKQGKQVCVIITSS